MQPSVLDKLAVIGRSGVLLAAVAVLLLVVLLVPFTIRQIYWLVESNRIIEETADPVVLDYPDDPFGYVPESPRVAWAAGQTLYVQRSICVYKRVSGIIERAIVDTARIPLDSVPLSSLLIVVPDAGHGPHRPPPWCGKTLSAITIPAFMAPSPAALQSTVDAHLNPLRPHVIIPLRPARFQIAGSPLRSEIDKTRAQTQALREAFEARTTLLTRKLDLLLERVREAERGLELVQGYHRQLDQHLRARHILPPAPGTRERTP